MAQRQNSDAISTGAKAKSHSSSVIVAGNDIRGFRKSLAILGSNVVLATNHADHASLYALRDIIMSLFLKKLRCCFLRQGLRLKMLIRKYNISYRQKFIDSLLLLFYS
jgi:hypothetical protein